MELKQAINKIKELGGYITREGYPHYIEVRSTSNDILYKRIHFENEVFEPSDEDYTYKGWDIK